MTSETDAILISIFSGLVTRFPFIVSIGASFVFFAILTTILAACTLPSVLGERPDSDVDDLPVAPSAKGVSPPAPHSDSDSDKDEKPARRRRKSKASRSSSRQPVSTSQCFLSIMAYAETSILPQDCQVRRGADHRHTPCSPTGNTASAASLCAIGDVYGCRGMKMLSLTPRFCFDPMACCSLGFEELYIYIRQTIL